MKQDIKEFLEQTLLCAVAIGVVFHLNSKISRITSSDESPQEPKIEQLDSAQVDTVRNIPKILAISKNQNTR